MSEEPRRAPKIALRAGFAALVLGATVLFVGSGSLAAQEQAPQGLQFAVHCTQVGEGADGGIGTVTCTLTVTGLPDPLDDGITLTLFRTDDAGGGPQAPAPIATVLSAVAPTIAAEAPVLAIRQIPNPSPSLLSVSPKVPDQPPKSL